MSEPIKINYSEEQLEFCLNTNCLGCGSNKGNYKDCPHFKNKQIAREKENN